jgi:hypothetical protein
MPVYAPRDDDWTTVPGPAGHALAVEVRTEDALPGTPDVVVHRDGTETFTLQTQAVPTGGETIHTVAGVDPETGQGTMLAALRAEGGEPSVDDLRPSDAPSAYSDAALEGFRDDLAEILIPVYIDDAVESLSEDIPGLVVLHTARFDDRTRCAYFRTSAFAGGDLQFEEEIGSL